MNILTPEEIIEWVKANALYINPKNKMWQAKLKEWEAQLAKAHRDRPECPECKGEKQIRHIDSSQITPEWKREIEYLKDCPTCKGTGKANRPEREKIAEKLYSFNTPAYNRRAWGLVPEAERKIYYNEAGQIAALFPDIEQAERERILNQMELEQCDPTVMAYHNDYYWLDKDVWQALKEEK